MDGLMKMGRTLCGCVSWNVCDEAGNLDAYRHTLRGCESWNYQCSPIFLRNNVAPFTGAWVEIKNRAKFIFSCSRTLCECVSWNKKETQDYCLNQSRTLCGCVSWNVANVSGFIFKACRTLYGRVSWNILKKKNVIMGLGHTLCGYVSWNDRFC